MKSLDTLIILFVVSQTTFGQWVLQPKVTTADLIQVRFIDRNTGWALGRFWESNGTRLVPAHKASVLRTTDAGGSWSELILENGSLHGLSIVNKSIGWAVGTTPGGAGLIVKTTDGGLSWFLRDSSATRSEFWSVQFLDELHGWIGGWNDSASSITRTTDGGLTWHAQYDTSRDFYELSFVDAMNGWVVGSSGKIYKTSDAGSSWQAVYEPSAFSSPLRRIQFADRLHGCAVGGIAATETKVWTSDGGVSWNAVVTSPPTAGSSLHGVWFTDANTGWCVGGANAGLTIQKTTDGGKTWVKQALPSSMTLYDIAYFEDVVFVSPTEGWIVGDKGTILKTTNGGESTTGIADRRTDAAMPGYQLHQNYPNPFNPSTAISYQLSAVSFVRLKIFDVLGRELGMIVNEVQKPGLYTARWDALGLPSGIYYYQLEAVPQGDASERVVNVKKMLLLR